MSVDVTTIEVVAPGAWAINGTARFASNRALVSVSVSTPDLLTHAGYLFTQLIVRSAANTAESCLATLINSMCWNLYHPCWSGYMPLTDTMILVASAAAVLPTPVYFNLAFTDQNYGDYRVNH